MLSAMQARAAHKVCDAPTSSAAMLRMQTERLLLASSPQETPRVWSNKAYNFDNLGMAFVSLFVTATLNGYTGEGVISGRSSASEAHRQPAQGAIGGCAVVQ